MDWETTPISFVVSVVIAAMAGAVASSVKEINGEKFQWIRFGCRTFYRMVLTTAGGLIISTVTSDLRILWASTILIAIAPIGEDRIINWLPFNVHETKNHRADD